MADGSEIVVDSTEQVAGPSEEVVTDNQASEILVDPNAGPSEEIVTDNQASEIVVDPNEQIAGPSEEIVTVSEPSPPEIVSLDDIMADVDIIRKKEAGDKVLIESIGNLSITHIREKAKLWALAGFPNLFRLYHVTILLPIICSDGVRRNVNEYIEFLTSVTLGEQLGKLQSKVQGFNIESAYMGNDIVLFLVKV